MSDLQSKLLAAGSQAAAAAADIMEECRDCPEELTSFTNVGRGDTIYIMADGLRLLIEAMPGEDANRAQLHAALLRFDCSLNG